MDFVERTLTDYIRSFLGEFSVRNTPSPLQQEGVRRAFLKEAARLGFPNCVLSFDDHPPGYIEAFERQNKKPCFVNWSYSLGTATVDCKTKDQ